MVVLFYIQLTEVLVFCIILTYLYSTHPNAGTCILPTTVVLTLYIPPTEVFVFQFLHTTKILVFYTSLAQAPVFLHATNVHVFDMPLTEICVFRIPLR